MDAFERAAKTFAQALLAVLVGNVTVISVNWSQALAVAGTAALVSVLTSLATATFGKSGNASMVRTGNALESGYSTQSCTSCRGSDTVQSILPKDSDGVESRVVHGPGSRSHS